MMKMPGLACCMGRYCVGSKMGQGLSLEMIRHFKEMIEKYPNAMLRNSKCK